MYRNKKDVDKYVDNLSVKLSAKEFKTRAYSIARLYYEVGDFVNCQKYAEQYLTQKDNNAAAYKLLGQALQKLGQKEKALDQFKTSLEIDPTQTSTILDICELLADESVIIEPGRAKYWSEKAEALFPRHPITFRLRERLVTMSDSNPEALVKLLMAELSVRPKDPSLHVRLLKHYLKTNKVKEAFDHSCQVEFSADNFLNNYSWYETLDELLEQKLDNTKDWIYQLLLLTVKERLCLLSLSEIPSGSSKSLVESSELLFAYNQALERVAKIGAQSGYAEFHQSLMHHHRGQFSLHAATYILKKAKKDQLMWREAIKISSPLMLIAWQTIPLDSKVKWLQNAPEKQAVAVNRWYIEGSYRCSQSGHYLITNFKDKSQSFLDQVSQICSGSNWKDKLYEKLFLNKTHFDIKSSFLVSDLFNPPVLKLPKMSEVMVYDDYSQRQYSNSLHHFIWTLLNYKNYADFKCTLFEMLTPTAANFGPETLNKFDIQAFLYCAALTARQQKQTVGSYGPDKPIIVPAIITDLLCPLPQMKWWDCAYKYSQNLLGTELTDIRATLSRGIEVVRCVDSHGLDPELLCHLGRIFNELAKNATLIEETTYIQRRSYLYYASAIPLLEKLKSKMMIRVSDKRMFDYTHKELSTRDLNLLIEESRLSVAENHLNDGEYEKVIDILINVKTPQAYYYLAQAYKKIALEENNSSTISKYVALLEKAKKYSFKALDTLKENDSYKTNALYPSIQEMIEEIEIHISKAEQEISNTTNDIDGKYSSDENISFSRTEPLKAKVNLFRDISSTPKANQNSNNTKYKTAIDSQLLEMTRVDQQHLERIENEIKNLLKRDSTINDFMDQTKNWFEENRKLGQQIITTINSNIQNTTDQFKLLKISVDQVKDQIDECRTECKDVLELKKQIAELKKEVNKLKKPPSDHTIDENDLYSLDDDYRSNDNTSNFTAQIPFPTQILPPFNQRPPFPIPPNPYQLYNQSLYNLYNQYSQFTQSSSVPGTSQLFDPTRPHMNFPGVYPNPEQMYLDVGNLIPSAVPATPAVPAATVVPPIPVVTSLPVMSVMSSVSNISAPTLATSSATFKTTTSTAAKDSKSLPVNVVITTSDPLPTCTSAPAPVLSVTIPQKHIKNSTPHNYQITMPTTNDTKFPPPVFSFTMPDNKSGTNTTTSLSNWKQAFQTFNTADKWHDNSISVVDGLVNSSSPNTSLNKSRTLSEKSNTSVDNYDPCPDFKPIIPLPDEVKVTTGEEEETVIFSSRAKLFRFVDKQWKERGLGEIKLLKHKVTTRVRVLMRREQVHKICANHLITSEMEINPMKNETKAYMWVANDFADETLVLEKFCVRFKSAEIAQKFYETFEKARRDAATLNISSTKTTSASTNIIEIPSVSTVTSTTASTAVTSVSSQINKTVIGGFSFSSTPVFKSVETDTKSVDNSNDTTSNKPNIFSGLTFKTSSSTPFSNLFNTSKTTPKVEDKQETEKNKLNASDTVEEFEPSVEFEPVVPLPALVEQKTGEEEENILFEHRAKLLRFDSTNKEWKERGLGNIKLLVHKDNSQKVRLLMRREQIMKVCCNHTLTKEMAFQKMPNVDKAVTWCAKDFSEGELVSETFCLRFKTAQICNDFLDAIKTAQTKMQDDSKAAKEEQNAARQSKPQSSATNEVSKPGIVSGWGDRFKPKAGSWECQSCFVRNEASAENCNACNSPKDPTAKPKTSTANSGASLPKFSFGIPAQKTGSVQNAVPIQNSVSKTVKSVATGFGDQFKPKEGSWECKQCFVRNDSTRDNCCACNSPKDSNAPKEQTSNVFGATTTKFQFGIPSSQPSTDKIKATPSIFDNKGEQKFTFGISSTNNSSNERNDQKPANIFFGAPKVSYDQGPINFSLKNNDDFSKSTTKNSSNLSTTQESAATNIFSNKESSFGFVFKPMNESKEKAKSPVKSDNNQGNESDGDGEEYVKDEDCSAHFNPVIPMPDKVEVVTGEENETQLYAHRAKLYIFVSNEWKERGLGIVKVLKHNETNKLRVVMRREQVLKICLNHALTPEVTYTSKDDKTWLFAVNDFSEGEINFQHFCLRFANKDIALEFKTVVDNARQGKFRSIEKGERQNADKKRDVDSDDVVFVNELQATTEEKQKAKELMLPENFYTYKSKDPCQGCRGCTEEDDKFEKPKLEQVKVSATSSTPSPVTTSNTITPTKTIPNILSPTNSIYGTPGNMEKTFDTSIFRTPLGSIGSQTLTPTSNSSDTKVETNKENIFSQKPSFSNFGENKSIFGTPQTLFGSGDSQTSISTKSSVLAPPKLSAQIVSTDKQSSEPKSLFSSAQVKPFADEKNSVFQNVGVSSNKSIFGFSSDQSNQKTIFGGGDQKPVHLFGSDSQGSIFKSGSFTNNVQKTETATSLFNSAPQSTQNVFKSIFSNTPNQESLSRSAESNADDKSNDEKSSGTESETKTTGIKEPAFIHSNLSFASFAAGTGPGFQKKEDFQWEGTGQQLFTAKPQTSGDKKDSGAGEEEYDPHYEPIVALPDEIVVTTGEEEEEKIFRERAKLYRYDDKAREWKERGVGEMKILYHPQRKTYRLLLRREQIYKAVLNMLVYMELELLPMKNSDQAWTWAGRNFAETPEGQHEMLAVRFKTAEIANKFRDQVVQCVRKMQAEAAKAIREEKEAEEKAKGGIALLRLPKHLEDSARADSFISTEMVKQAQAAQSLLKSNGESKQAEVYSQEESYEVQEDEEHEYADDDEDEHDYDGEYNEEDDDNAAYYSCDGEVVVRQDVEETTCANAHILVMFDHDTCTPKILITDSNTGEILADMLIHTDTEFQKVNDNVCTWSGTDYTSNDPVDKTVTVKFYDENALMEFYDSCETSKAATYSSTDPES